VDKELIKNLISSEIADAECVFEGDSCNFKLLVISKSFEDISLIEQHKMVLLPLKKAISIRRTSRVKYRN
jgi:acid stress-induced BolA-like protein IbaG/YrbA